MAKLNRPNREPDLILEDGGEKLELWLNEMIECYHNTTSRKGYLSNIRFNDNGTLEFQGISGHWCDYIDTSFEIIDSDIANFIADEILLGE